MVRQRTAVRYAGDARIALRFWEPWPWAASFVGSRDFARGGPAFFPCPARLRGHEWISYRKSAYFGCESASPGPARAPCNENGRDSIPEFPGPIAADNLHIQDVNGTFPLGDASTIRTGAHWRATVHRSTLAPPHRPCRCTARPTSLRARSAASMSCRRTSPARGLTRATAGCQRE
jgi:hypothetical protein